MKTILGRGTDQFEVLTGEESVLTFRDRQTALSFLRDLAADPLQMATLRARRGTSAKADGDRTDEEFLQQLAAEMVSGRLQFLRRRSPVPFLPPLEAASAPLVGPASRSTAREKTWIEIVLVDDEGKPVPNEPVRIELPDGSIKEGKLDGRGAARVEGIDPGECKVSFPELRSAGRRRSAGR